jgi:hypothetical protein
MYTQEHINLLNRFGVLSTALIARKDKCDIRHAKKILLAIVKDYENVHFRNECQIFIEGREPDFWKPKEKKREMKRQPKKNEASKKLSRWKDVTKS